MMEWRPILGYEGYYEVSDEGQVRSLDRLIIRSDGPRYNKPGRVLRQTYYAPTKRYYVPLSVDGTMIKRHVHVIVAEAFLGPRPPGLHVCHNDGDPSNNRASNLRYDTPSANVRDCVKHGMHNNAKKTHCKRGHEFNAENTINTVLGNRGCRICSRVHKAAWRRRQREKSAK